MARKTPLQNIFGSLQGSGSNYQTTTPDNYLDNPNNPNNQVENGLQNTNTTTVTNPLSGLAGIGNGGGIMKAPVTTPKPGIQPDAILPSQQTSNNSIFNPDQYLQQQLGALGNQQNLAQEDIIKAYQKVSGQLGFQKAQQNSQYENLDLINEKVGAVTKQFEQGVKDPLLISRNTGLTPEEVNKVIRGDIYKDLKLNERTAFEANKPFQQQLSDFELTKQRNLEDINTKTERAKMLLTQHLDDITREMTESTSALGKMGALSQQGLSSGFQMGIENIKDNANRVMDTLKQTADRENTDTLKVKDRMLEDYTTNVTRIKDVAENEFNKIKLQGLAAIQEIDQKWGLSSENAYNALRKLYADTDSAKGQLYKDQFAMYQDLNTMTLNRAKAIGDVFGQGAAQDFLSQQGMYQPTPQESLVGQRAEESGFYTPGQITTEGKTFGGMGGFDIAGAINDPILAQKGGKIIRFGLDTPVTQNGKTYPANRYIEIQGEDGNIIRYNHLNGIGDGNMSRGQDMVGKTVQAGQQIGLMGRSGVTSYDPKKGGNSGVHLDITAYPPERAGSKAVKAYQSMDDQRRILLGQGGESGQQNQPDVTDAELAFYLKGSAGIGKGKLTQQRYNEVSDYVSTIAKEDPGAVISLLPQNQQDRIYKIMDEFDSNVNKTFQVVQEGKNFIDEFDTKNASATDDQSLMYAVAKLMDPDSVVRDSEYATTAAFAQSALSKFGIDVSRVFINGQALTEAARNQLIKSIGNIYKSKEKTYETQLKNYGNRVKTFTKIDGTPFLSDLRGEYQNNAQNNTDNNQQNQALQLFLQYMSK